MELELFVDLYNIYNHQGTAGVDDNYAPQFKLSAPNGTAGPSRTRTRSRAARTRT